MESGTGLRLAALPWRVCGCVVGGRFRWAGFAHCRKTQLAEGNSYAAPCKPNDMEGIDLFPQPTVGFLRYSSHSYRQHFFLVVLKLDNLLDRRVFVKH